LEGHLPLYSEYEYDVFLNNANLFTEELKYAQHGIYVAGATGSAGAYTVSAVSGDLTLRAGEEIVIEEDFDAPLGSLFLAEIEAPISDTSVSYNLKEQHIYGNRRLGLQDSNTRLAFIDDVYARNATVETKTYTRLVGDKRYELSNHLGNVLSIVTDRKIPDNVNNFNAFTADVVTYNEYYPFGMLMPNKHANSGDYRYGYMGEEKDDEVKGEGNHISYAQRGYDPRIGRWISIDPYSAVMSGHSPYSFALNNPIFLVDQDGEYPKPSELLSDYGMELPPLAAGIIDGIVDASFFGTVGFVYDLATDSQFRQDMVDAFKMIASDPIGFAKTFMAQKAEMFEKAMNGDPDALYELGNELGSITVGIFTGGTATKVVKWAKEGAQKAKMAKKAKRMLDCPCFTGETTVLTREGYKTIENIEIGSKVWIYDTEKDELVLKEVSDRIENVVNEIYEVYIAGEFIEVPAEFTFTVNGKEKLVKDLNEGELVTLYNGEQFEVEKIIIKKGSFKVYDLEFNEKQN
jgi:RHS repeat-associated protein